MYSHSDNTSISAKKGCCSFPAGPDFIMSGRNRRDGKWWKKFRKWKEA